jgi:5S rRNA maturation endonuclease (ribonuclease M5)
MEYSKFPKHVMKMTGREIERYLPNDYTNAHLMRSIIMNEKQFYESDGDSRTLRGVWYSTVKPTLDKLGLLTESDQTEEGLTKWDATLSKYMASLLRSGLLLYEDLGIYDVSRRRSTPREAWYSGGEGRVLAYQASVAPYPNIIIATEKDTVYNIIKDMADILGLSCISCKGQNSLGAMESLVKSMFIKNGREIKAYELEFSEVYILTLTDYDPAGYYIADALEKQVTDILKAIGRSYINVEYKRIGITPDQLSMQQVEANKYTPKPANMDKWMESTNGVYGERKGLELDALSSKQIRQIFTEEIEPFIDTEIYTHFLKTSYLKEKILFYMSPHIERMCDDLIFMFEDQIEVDEVDPLEYAAAGYNQLPRNSICRFEEGEIETLKQAIEEYFKK